MSLETEKLVDEYTELRAEIRHYLQRRQTNKNFAYVVTLGVLGFGFGLSNTYLLFFVCALIVSFLWIDEIRRLRAIFRTGAYISLAIESKIPSMNWETMSTEHKLQDTLFFRLYSNADLPLLFMINTGLGAWKLWPVDNLVTVITCIVFLVILLILSIKSFLFAKKGMAEEKSYMNDLLHTLGILNKASGSKELP